jgi:hypothetical protein
VCRWTVPWTVRYPHQPVAASSALAVAAPLVQGR